MIYKVVEFIQEVEGEEESYRKIHVATPTDSEGRPCPPQEVSPRFMGLAIIQFREMDMQGQTAAVRPVPINFPIPAETLEEAFQKFDDLVRQEAENLRHGVEERVKEIRQEMGGRIIPVSSIPSNLNKEGSR